MSSTMVRGWCRYVSLTPQPPPQFCHCLGVSDKGFREVTSIAYLSSPIITCAQSLGHSKTLVKFWYKEWKDVPLVPSKYRAGLTLTFFPFSAPTTGRTSKTQVTWLAVLVRLPSSSGGRARSLPRPENCPLFVKFARRCSA